MNLHRVVLLITVLGMLGTTAAFAQADREEDEPVCAVTFIVTKADNGKPVRNAAVIMHPVNPKGRQNSTGAELKTDGEGKTSYDYAPYGKLRIQVLAPGFQTYGEDFDIDKPKMELAIKLKRPQGQYSLYDDHSSNPAPKPDAPPPNQNQKPN